MTHYVGLLGGSGDVWGIRIPDLPGCHGGGGTAEAAIADATSAARDWATYQITHEVTLRSPRTLAEIMADPEAEFSAGEIGVMIPLVLDRGRSVRANVSLDAGVLEAIDAAAKQAGITRSAFIVSAALEKIGAA